MRRSPPGDCSPALPLDLHVLGLSLAFILSQDQTLRCCYLVFFLFRNCRRGSADLGALKKRPPLMMQSIVAFLVLLTESVAIPKGLRSLLYYFVLYCKSFNVLVPFGRLALLRQWCKVTDFFRTDKILS